MKIYIGNNGDPNKLKVIRNHDLLGLMFTPIDYKLSWKHHHALDNGAWATSYNGRCFDVTAFLKALKRVADPDFAVIPDIVGGGRKSLELSLEWRDILPDRFKWYLAVQDGMTPRIIPESLLRNVDGLFVGGSVDWKWDTAETWIEFAHSLKIKCHIGRVGDLEKLMHAQRLGADSGDSTNFAKHARQWRQLMIWLYGEQKSLELSPS